ncbi:phytanoyl-CoA dioxygenase family protein [Stenomitos frigidus]|uniref:Phytanoyl-CoA dioxygenase family protein n=1 Tax=Stenomitos frigidus ULC18 TaxID=2107698 RepID=A0A2T1ES39_9CYAN|nr:phytanoyl-CoA dioxygenase family protein [Stenomitos frigidus]PSB35570.1 phytanoyl-CoA dioxygenase family protein [Stenomitos frigidus ULC18]
MEEKELRETFERDGFVICKGVFSKEEMKTLLQDIEAAQRRYDSDNLTRGSMTFKSSIFFNEPKLQAFASQQKVIDLLKNLAGPDIWVRWDQAVAKGPGADTFPWHQDNHYSKLIDPHYQFWVALTDSHENNGGLWVQPGSHKKEQPYRKVGYEMVYGGKPESPVLITAEPGDVVIFSSFTLHSTTPNTTQDTRWAYVIEYMSLEHYDPYVTPPYFVVARDGKSCPEFVETYRGRENLLNRVKYRLIDLTPTTKMPGWVKQAQKVLTPGTR